jgi:hypothetical protein
MIPNRCQPKTCMLFCLTIIIVLCLQLIRIEAGASEVQQAILKRKACDTNEVLDPERKVMRS